MCWATTEFVGVDLGHGDGLKTPAKNFFEAPLSPTFGMIKGSLECSG